MNHDTHCDLLEQELGTLVATMRRAEPAAPVPSCPGWTVSDLATHLGQIHRWADTLVARRAPQRIPASDIPNIEGDERPRPEDSAEVWAAWLGAGGTRLVPTLRAADPDAPMWAWGADQHVRFWSRRQLHETTMHRIDLELALDPEKDAGRTEVEPAVAVDGIDEFFDNLAAAAYFSPNVRQLTGEGSVHLHATDTEGEWMIQLTPDGFTVTHGHGKGDVAARGTAAQLLAVVYRRSPIGGLEIFGDRELLDWWITHSALQ